MKGMGLGGIGPVKPVDDEPEGADVLAMKAFTKSLKGSDSQAQVTAFRELMACCEDYEAEAVDDE